MWKRIKIENNRRCSFHFVINLGMVVNWKAEALIYFDYFYDWIAINFRNIACNLFFSTYLLNVLYVFTCWAIPGDLYLWHTLIWISWLRIHMFPQSYRILQMSKIQHFLLCYGFQVVIIHIRSSKFEFKKLLREHKVGGALWTTACHILLR